MITDNDIYYSFGKQGEGVIAAIAFGIDGYIVETMSTYTSFIDLINLSSYIECINDDCSMVNFMDKSGLIIQTLKTNSKLGSILASEPVVFELMRRNPDNSAVEPSSIPAKNREVVEGWRYDDNGLIPPEGWTPSIPPTLEEMRQAAEQIRASQVN